MASMGGSNDGAVVIVTRAAAGATDGEATAAGATLGAGTARPTTVGGTPPGVGAGRAADDGTGETAGLTAGGVGAVEGAAVGAQALRPTVIATPGSKHKKAPTQSVAQ
jgi:hypothetical protein